MNPYLPQDYCIPDGEPHVFGDRLYIYGSQDQLGGDGFCLLDYEVFSAPLSDLSRWRSEGKAYSARWDPDYTPTRDNVLFAPDCVQGNDGRFYLYYATSGGHLTSCIRVAVSDNPGGPFQFHGCVRAQDGTPLRRGITFDPAVLNDDGQIRLYYGFSATVNPGSPLSAEDTLAVQQQEAAMFEKTPGELSVPGGISGCFTVTLAEDMLTVTAEPVRVLPGQLAAQKTDFCCHAFFEASSIRKIGKRYYLVYSSEVQHELCYAVSDRPDRGFCYGGVLISNGNIGFHGQKTADATTGNNHGGMVQLNGQWYIFYHRQTHTDTFSRQGCAEPIQIAPDGSIAQVQTGSCGLNGGPLPVEGEYPATVACSLYDGPMPHAGPNPPERPVPHITHRPLEDGKNEHYITEIHRGTVIAYRRFAFDGPTRLTLLLRRQPGSVIGPDARLEIWTEDVLQGTVALPSDGISENSWQPIGVPVVYEGAAQLDIRYFGGGAIELLQLHWD